jgi:hypothetical protein
MDMIFHVVFLGAVSLFLVGSAFLLSFFAKLEGRGQRIQALPSIVSAPRR